MPRGEGALLFSEGALLFSEGALLNPAKKQKWLSEVDFRQAKRRKWLSEVGFSCPAKIGGFQKRGKGQNSWVCRTPNAGFQHV